MTDNGILARCEYLFSQNKWISPTNVKSLFLFAKLQKAELKRLKEENERLKKECGNQSELWSKHFESLFETAKETIKSEARKEFAGRLKNKIFSEDYLLCEPCDMANTIDNILKEMESDVK